MTEHDDKYFIGLIMKINEKDPKILKEWIKWCNNSEGRYYIASDDEDMYTAMRTPEEAKMELQRQKMLGYINSQRDALNPEELGKESWGAYEDYVMKKINTGEFLTSEVMSYEMFKKQRDA